MTQSTDHTPTTLYARALWNIANLQLNNRVTISSEIDEQPGHDLFTETVRVDVFGYPTERDELIAALGSPSGREWQGETGARYREWRGELLTMNLCVQDMVSEPVASAPAAGEPLTCLGAPGGFHADCGLPGPHGPHPLDEIPPPADDEPVLRPAVPAVVGIAPATDGRDYVAEAYATYARALFAFQHEGVRFTTGAGVLAAVDAWKGRFMLTRADVGQLAAELVVVDDEPAEIDEVPPNQLSGVADIAPRPYVEPGRGAWLFRRRVGRRGGHRPGTVGTI